MTAASLRVWDLPTRLFHWGLVLAVGGALATAWIPGIAIEWHARCGYAVLALLLFRLAWGLVGGHWSRFSAWRPSPARLWADLRGRLHPHDRIGHSPLGTLSVIAILSLLAVQVGTGLIGDDEIAFTGPLNRFVSTATGLAATGWHKELGKLLVIALIVLHVTAIAYYALVRRIALVGPMVHGNKPLDVLGLPASGQVDLPPSRDDGRSRLLALVLAAGSVAVVAWVAGLAASSG
jgi:cytochrome b